MKETISLRDKTVSAMLYSFGGFVANSGIQFVISIVLARLLLPKDFGVIGMITVFIAISQVLIDGGMIQALIREKNVTQADYSTVFYYNLLVASAMYGLLFISSRNISNFFREPILEYIVPVVGLGIIISSLGLIQRTMLIRNLDFKTQSKIDVIAAFASGSCAVVFAFFGYGVWSLVASSLLNHLISLFLLLAWNKWQPSLTFNPNSLKSFFGFGWKLLLTGLFATFYRNLVSIIIGRTFSATQLGYYSKSRSLCELAVTSVTSSISKVSYPVLSSLQDDENIMGSGFRTIIKNASFLTFPMLIGLIAIANPLIQVLFGDNWMPMVPYFQILCLSGMTFPHVALNYNILNVKGRSDLFLLIDITNMVVGLICIGASLSLGLGIYGLLWSSLILGLVALFTTSYYSEKFVRYSTREQLKDALPTVIVSIFMGIIVYICGLLFPFYNVAKILLQVIIGVITYIAISKLANIEELNTVCNLLTKFYSTARARDKGLQL